MRIRLYTRAVSAWQAPEFHPAFEEYCEAVFELHEDDVDVIQARVADRLNVSRPAVSEMIHRMEAEGLLTLDDAIELTPAGTRLAEQVVRRHRLAERFLTDILSLSWAEAHTEAGKWEHVISEPVEAAMVRVLGDPTTCPHGNPIPGAGYTEPDTVPLSEVGLGHPFTVARITEDRVEATWNSQSGRWECDISDHGGPFWGTLDGSLTTGSSQTVDIIDNTESTTGDSVTAYDRLLATGETIATGTKVLVQWIRSERRWYVTAAECE